MWYNGHDADVSRAVALSQFTGQETFLLLGVHLLDESLLGLEVKGHRVVLIGVAAHLEDRSANQPTELGGIYSTGSMHH